MPRQTRNSAKKASPAPSMPADEDNETSQTIPEREQETADDRVTVDVDGIQIKMTVQEFLKFRNNEKERELAQLKIEKELEVEKMRVANAEKSREEGKKLERYYQKLTDNKDPEEYFTAFEHYARREEWHVDTWVRRLSQSIEGKALVAMNSVMTHDISYEQLKRAILEVFQLSAESYRNKFRMMKKMDNETIKSFITRLAHTYDQFVKYSDIDIQSEDAKALSQLMIREQLFQTIPYDMKKHLTQSKLLDTAKLATEAEEYASLDPKYWQKHSNRNGQNNQQGKGNHFQKGDNNSRKRPYNDKTQNDKPQDGQKKNAYQRGQGNWGKGNHGKPSGTANVRRCGVQQSHDTDNQRPAIQKCKNKFIIPGVVEGKRISIFRDSGCDKTAVNSKLIPSHCYTGKSVEVKGVTGQIHVPLAKVNLNCSIHVGEIEVLAIDELDHDLLLGTEIDSWDDLQQNIPNILVMTRAQKLHSVDKEILAQDTIRNYIDNNNDEPNDSIIDENSFDDKSNLDEEMQDLLQGDVKTLIKLQNEDETLKKIRASLNNDNDENGYYRHENGIIMRRCQAETRLRKQVGDQIVAPRKYRQHILEISHDRAGHSGVNRTRDRISQHFHWPNINHDVARHCQTCEQCQFMSKSKQTQKQLLKPLPIIDVPFKRVGVDIKGPLPVTEQGNKYILVVCDYATRYPEAIPISDQTADTVAYAMLEIFSRTGIPTEIVHDRGTQFMSKVMSKMCKKLGIQQLPATSYHQQTNGLTERFIGTLSAMINSLDQGEFENWDKHLPLFLFSYREIPSDFTGYSPFHLMYGRQIRGPLELMKQGFLGESDGQDIPSKLLEMSANMMTWMANAKVKKAQKQKKMKQNYDKKAIDRHFKVGDKVLVFLPQGGGKFESKWQGPYDITKKVNDLNYEIHMPDKMKSHRVLHTNLIKRYYDRQQAQDMKHCYCVTGTFHDVYNESEQPSDHEFDSQYVEEYIGPTYVQTQTWKDANISEEISKSQKDQIQNVMKMHECMFSDVPGKTNVISHKVITTTDAPIKQKSYRTPQAMKTKVQEEIDNMLALGVIEEVNSAYASPIVAVTKPNGDIRLCTNYKALNKCTVVDPYEMPRVDEILEDVASAKFITSLDLTKGFYQVPLDCEAKAKSAFVAFGRQYAYNVMPFGMVNSSATFQRLVDEVLMDCKSYCRQYIDDIAIFSNSWEDHLEHVNTVLAKIKQAGLTIKPSKCRFAYQQVTYLGHTVGNGQIKPNIDKLKAVNEFPKPLTKKDVRSFLGLAGYYRKFVTHYEHIARPMINLTKKKEPNKVIWTPECEKSFQDLKTRLTSAPILKAPDFSKPFLLQTDASLTGLGAVLTQLDDQLREHPVVYLSKQLKPSEKNYAISELECLAIVWSIGKLRYYLQGRKFTVITDHKALQWLDKTKLSNSKLMRWSLLLQEFNFDIQYRKGICNTNADSLSRICISN